MSAIPQNIRLNVAALDTSPCPWVWGFSQSPGAPCGVHLRNIVARILGLPVSPGHGSEAPSRFLLDLLGVVVDDANPHNEEEDEGEADGSEHPADDLHQGVRVLLALLLLLPRPGLASIRCLGGLGH